MRELDFILGTVGEYLLIEKNHLGVSSVGRTYTEADARLFAAAPDMVVALKSLHLNHKNYKSEISFEDQELILRALTKAGVV